MRPFRRLLVLLAATVLVLLAPVPAFTPVPAHADPDPDGSLPAGATIQDQLATAIKGYLDAKTKLDAAVARQEKFKADLATSTTRLSELTGRLGILASAEYKAGPASTVAMMLDATSPDDAVQRAEALRTLGRSEDRQLREYQTVLAQADKQQAALQQEVAQAQTQANEATKRKADLQKTLDQLGTGPTAGVPIPAATADPVPRNADGSLPAEHCSEKDPTTTGCLTPRTLHALQQAHKAGFNHFVACYRPGTFAEHPLGRACDFAAAPGGFAGIASGADRDYGNKLAGWFIANAQRLGVMYVIWFHQIWNPVVGWHYYAGDGTPSGNHTNHVHLSEL
jgi:hypothetical protein